MIEGMRAWWAALAGRQAARQEREEGEQVSQARENATSVGAVGVPKELTVVPGCVFWWSSSQGGGWWCDGTNGHGGKAPGGETVEFAGENRVEGGRGAGEGHFMWSRRSIPQGEGECDMNDRVDKGQMRDVAEQGARSKKTRACIGDCVPSTLGR